MGKFQLPRAVQQYALDAGDGASW